MMIIFLFKFMLIFANISEMRIQQNQWYFHKLRDDRDNSRFIEY